MNFNLKPSLQHTEAVTVVSTLRIEDDVNDIVKDWFRCEFVPEIHREIKKKVLKKVARLSLDKFLEDKILHVVSPMIDEVIIWMSKNNDLPKTVLKKNFLCWTSAGLIDYKKTAKVLSENEDLDISVRYNIACKYCLESDIPNLWDKLPEDEKEYLIEECDFHQECADASRLWALRMNKVSTDNALIPEFYRWQSVFKWRLNKETTEYALQKLTSEEREQSLILTTKVAVNEAWEEGSERILFFLLTQISEAQQMEIFQKFPSDILKNLLKGYRKQFFLETAQKLWNFLSLKNYLEIIKCIINEAYKNDDYKELLIEFWQKIPDTHKEFVFDKSKSMIYRSIQVRNENNINKWIRIQTMSQHILILIQKGKWDDLHFIFSNCFNYVRETK